jgi:alpha-ketoglutarate-dependent taurine dioxygenase
MRLEPLSPFGLVVISPADIATISVPFVRDLIEEHRVVIFRDFATLEGNAFPEFCARFGEILEWDFGAVNDLVVHDAARNYLYTNHAVPFHWDGAFAGTVPRYIFFHCDLAPGPGDGGETLFCDTTRVLEHASLEQLALWEQIVITYSTEKIVHYGGTFTSPVIAKHPINLARVLRYAEPVVDLNPVTLSIEGIAEEDRSAFIDDMGRRLRDARCCYPHRWLAGDLVIADNHTLLHGRDAFRSGASRHIRRVNIV